jgi:hypothetical protein
MTTIDGKPRKGSRMIAMVLYSCFGLFSSQERGRQEMAGTTQRHGTPAVKSGSHTWPRLEQGARFITLPNWLQTWSVWNSTSGYPVLEDT